MSYSVYEHIFPNGKKYIGISKSPEERWADGRGYADNVEMFKDIVRFGWDNIEHRILMKNLSREEAQVLESKMIVREDGTCIGTIGGGCMEAQVQQEARSLFRSGDAKEKTLQLTLRADEAAEEGMVCGGALEIRMELL